MPDDRKLEIFLELEAVDEEEEIEEEPRYLTLHGRHGEVRRALLVPEHQEGKDPERRSR